MPFLEVFPILHDTDPPLLDYFAISAMLPLFPMLLKQISNNFTLVGHQVNQIIELHDDPDASESIIISNTLCFVIVALYKLVQYIILGPLRVQEKQVLREAFWDYFLHKSLFVIVLNVRDCNDWAVWYTILGSILLLSRLSKDRFEHLASTPSTKRWPLIRIAVLMISLLIITTLLLVYTIPGEYRYSTYRLFQTADVTYVLTFVLYVILRCSVLGYDMSKNYLWEAKASLIYYSDLIFATIMFAIEILHHSHVILFTNICVKILCLLKIHFLVSDIRLRYKRHHNYSLIVQLMESNFSMASQKDIEENNDDCAICWDEMCSARKLPCGHLFHNSCLRSWLVQDTSCPTCRTSLKIQQEHLNDEIEDNSDEEDEFIEAARTHQRNHLFRFDSSTYTNHPFLSWMPTISIEGFM